MISVVLVGTGNVAQNLFQALDKMAHVKIEQVLGRNPEHLTFAIDKAPLNTNFDDIPHADVYILAVSDNAIATVAEKFKNRKGLVVHTSGATSMQELKDCDRYGVFYPLQTFTIGKTISFQDIPICLEVNNINDRQLVQSLGKSLSNNVQFINTEERRALHIAAVFVNNFTNYMYTMGEEICMDNGVDFSLLLPLIKETAAKLDNLPPLLAQTGPAKRGDQNTLHTHLKFIKNKQQREIYTLVSNAIKRTHGEKL
ncbi:Predicted oxidoreductase, contains short-chain dehydrogenase (SDR) and DUF2520 domains [Maribacter sedimenticola]|uniref:Predicted oxidoreductase, contains short-chain dehydrogenase (SDR) and DUF2520 domains n=1 Tax=Maribacter sedimenticola TaxID=228956 RepID=A0ABY1SH60_9FLAO|nr:Rossmann-like and DUF2520 domain-containing protein [Maribacter sedimenticola]SNR48498.1 Predicted oxidoreductase, contains short-chain dehydrogenase (SDR) and DUF2520 domains [Maribacter sedimenticola]